MRAIDIPDWVWYHRNVGFQGGFSMLFSSTTFLYLFLPAVLFCYYVLLKWSRRLQNVFLLAASLFFYAWGEPKFVLVMMASIAINWALGLVVHKLKDRPKAAKVMIAVDVLLNLGLLFVFKYLNFTAFIVGSILKFDPGIGRIALPIGISFFTFQAMSYVLDVYRGKGEVQKNILYVGLYISFFPQLIAGPIVRYETVAHEIKHRKETLDDFFDGFARFVVGLAKKVLLSNTFAFVADQAFNAVGAGETLSVGFSWLGALAYTMQIFFDFGGYSDMAIGLGRMFGFHFLENFNYPYIATSITDFWRRWHMSLGTWFRDYVYIPLGGSRVKKGRMIFNLFVVWFLTGVWHGANFTFIVWGLLYFVLLTVEKLTGFHQKKGKLIAVVKWLYAMFFVILGWVLFRAESIPDAVRYMGCMFGFGGPLVDGKFTGFVTQYGLVMSIGVFFCTPALKMLTAKIKPNIFLDILRVLLLFGLFVLSVATLVGSSYNPFIYFNF